MRKNLLFFILLLSTVKLQAQNLLQGKVVDIVTGEAIPFVSIGVIGTNQTTVTNDAGEFILKNVTLPAKLRYSHVSYLLLEHTSETSVELLIKLTPAAISLKPVVIDPYKGLRLVKAALEKATTFKQKTFYGNAFYRQLTTLNDKPSQIYELFYDLELNVSKVKGWIAKQTRFAELNDGIAFSMSNQSYLTFMMAGSLFDDQKSMKLVTLKTLKEFEISVDKYIEQKDQDIAVVSCRFKGNKKKSYVNSTYYIGTEDFKVYRVESSIFNLPLKVSGSSTQIPPAATIVTTFNGTTTPIPILESISTKLYLNLNARGTTLKPVISSMLTVYQLDKSLDTQKFTQLSRNVKDKAIVESIVYNPEFWKDNPIVKKTTLEETFIKMMESKSAFGTMIDP